MFKFAILSLTLFISGCASHPSNTQNTPAKNVILFIGDGMGVSTVTATRIYVGQKQGGTGEEYVLPFETFPSVALVKTYNTNQQVPDSAGTATAMNTGLKTKAGVIGIGPNALRGDCASAQSNALESIAQHAHAHQKKIGIVTTTRLTHATPAAVYAHTPERGWEADSDIPAVERAKGCVDIARQLMDFPFHIALGGGKREFFNRKTDGRRTDSLHAVMTDWQAQRNGDVVYSKADLANANHRTPTLGLFSNSHMAYMADTNRPDTEPSLTEMTLTAIKALSTSKNGYYLMVEGGRIDHGHHDGKAGYALSEGEEFAKAISAALKHINLEETLVLVTADHSHVFTIAGYPTRGNDILGLVYGNDRKGLPNTTPTTDLDQQPYTTLGYWNGPGARKNGTRPMPEVGIEAQQQAVIRTGYINSKGEEEASETHGGEDVALYAIGSNSDLVKGVIEQNLIHRIIRQAFGWPTHDANSN